MIGPGHIRLQNTVSDIQDKYRDIKRLEEVLNKWIDNFLTELYQNIEC